VVLDLRPLIRFTAQLHWTAPRVRAHVLLCMLAYYLEWHMRQKLAPLLFDDHDRAAAEPQRASPVAKAQVSLAARHKAGRKHTEPIEGETLPVHSFRPLLADLATLTRNTICFGGEALSTVLATPTAVQRRVLNLLGVQLAGA